MDGPETSKRPCDQCGRRTAEHDWEGRTLCHGCWVDLTVCRFIREWSGNPAIRDGLTYKGVPLAGTLEYDLLSTILAELKDEPIPSAEGKQ